MALENKDDMEADGPIELDAGVDGVGAMSISIFLSMGSLCCDTPPCIHLPDLISSSCFFLHRIQTQMTFEIERVTIGLKF